MVDWSALSWRNDGLGEGVAALGRISGLIDPQARPLQAPPDLGESERERTASLAASAIGLEVVQVETAFGNALQMLAHAGPALLAAADEGAGWLLIVSGNAPRLKLLAPDGRIHPVATTEVRAQLFAQHLARVRPQVDKLLTASGVAPQRLERTRLVLSQQQLDRALPASGIFLLKLPASASAQAWVRHAGLWKLLCASLALHAAQMAAWIGSWWILGHAALEGRTDCGALLAWVLLLFTLVPLRVAGAWVQGILSLRAGVLLKTRLLLGALRLQPDAIRHQGIGQLMGRVFESELVESLALSGGFLTLMGSVELAAAAVVLHSGAGATGELTLLSLWTCLGFGGALALLRSRTRWTEQRLGLTHELIERMAGHRTRLAQEPPEQWHRGEDEALSAYARESRVMDGRSVGLSVVLPRGWLVLGVSAMLPAFASGGASAAQLAVAVGGVLLGFAAFQKLGGGASHLAGAFLAWKEAKPLLEAVRGHHAPPTASGSLRETSSDAVERRKDIVLDARDLSYRHKKRANPVLHEVSVRIRRGERILLEGPSGGGKSTLASLITAVRKPDSGLLLLGGLDHASLGEDGWRRRVAAAPQFHENHVLNETLAFNLLMGKRWPPSQEDLKEALDVCSALGLDGLLAKMPSGLLQQVGESGWQLSHGERSRLFLARALLQKGELLVLDESLAALDPENARRCLSTLLKDGRALVMIAHP